MQSQHLQIGSENLSQPEPIAIIGRFQNVPPDDNNCSLKRVVHFELHTSGAL